jgi:hypothetical protein
MKFSRRDLITGAIGAAVGATGTAVGGFAFRPRSEVNLTSRVDIRVEGSFRVVEANGLPGHEIGDFPNRHDPIAVKPQAHRLRMPLRPSHSRDPIPLDMRWFGVALNGVPFDPSGPFWNGDAFSGWQFEVMHPANSIVLGIDRNNAHTQMGGIYHYHGMPAGLVANLTGNDASRVMQMVGYAADGYPIYGPECPAFADDLDSPTRRLRSSYRLADGKRTNGPGGEPDGRFVEDHIYDQDYGDLDECNGRFGPTPEFPDGTFYYVLTDSFPYIPRFYRGQPDMSFEHGPPPGVSAPVPPELSAYRSS